MERRISTRGRFDDKPEVVRKRIALFQDHSASLKYEFGKRCKVIRAEDHPSQVWVSVDRALGKMMEEWAFKTRDVSGLEDDVTCSGSIADYTAAFPTSIRPERKKASPEFMHEVVSGVIPYFVRMDCTRSFGTLQNHRRTAAQIDK